MAERKVRFIHYSNAPVSLASLVSKSQDISVRALKPNGFWFSVDGEGDGWADWCRAEEWGLHRLVAATEVEIGPDARILTLSSAYEIDSFTKEFRGGRRHDGIDWPVVAERWQGIIIAPYIWARRMSRHTFWYYGWDCASGCVWDVSSIAALRPIDAPVLTEAKP